MTLRNALFCFPFHGCWRGFYNAQSVMDYGEFLRECKTGDILLFEGKGIYSWLIQCATQSKYSHIGMVVKIQVPGVKEPMTFLWESTKPDGSYDFITRVDKDGPRMVSIHEKVYEYSRANFSIHYRPFYLHDDSLVDDIQSGETSKRSWEIFMRGAQIPYETEYGELANAHKRWVVGSEAHTPANQNAVFCSEAVMWYYKEAVGLSLRDESHAVPLEWEPENFTPNDFAMESEGIPFAYASPPQATFGGQYVLATRDAANPKLAEKYRQFQTEKRKLAEAFSKAIDEHTSVKDRVLYIEGPSMPRILFGTNAYQEDDASGMGKIELADYP